MLTESEDIPIVRLAALSDEEELMEMCRAKHAEEGLRAVDGTPFPWSPEKCRATLHAALIGRRNDPSAGQAWCGILGLPGSLEGSVYLTVQEPQDSDGLYLQQVWAWVRPCARRNSSAQALLAFSQVLADSLGVPLIGHGKSHALRFARRHGCQPIASIYIYPTAGA